QRKVVNSGERIFGSYITDEITSPGSGLPTYPGTMQVGAFLPMDIIRKFDGCSLRAIRIGLPVAANVSKVFIYAIDKSGKVGDLITSANVTTQAAMGWNEQVLNAPITVDANRENLGGYLMGFEYEQVNTQRHGSYTADCYPLSFVNSGKVYRTYGRMNGQWTDIDATSMGNLSVQAIAKSDQFPQKDLILSAIDIDTPLTQAGEKLNYSFTVENFGWQDIADYAVEVKLDDTVVNTITDSLDSLATKDVKGSLTLDKELVAGSHSISATVTAIDGSAPTERTLDDRSEQIFSVYGEADVMPRQQYLVESFTSTEDVYAPYGLKILNTLQSAHDNVSVVNIHCNASESDIDPFGNDTTADIALLLDMKQMPTAAMNRCYLGEVPTKYYYGMLALLAFDESYATVKADEFYKLMSTQSTPSLVTLDVEATSVDGNLTVNVNGMGGEHARQLLEKTGSLSVYLVEDDVEGRQQTSAGTTDGYRHDNVWRAMLTDINGDELTWTDDQHFTNTFTTTLAEDWNANNMRAIAFVHLATDVLDPNYTTMGISNATSAKLTVTSGISDATLTDVNERPVAIYSADGVLRNSLQRGINIVRMSDGTTRKVLIGE
ncbi:MAG: Omp28-related outer membrane protein, partial [Prevotella sp.]|nr:Omp28-related outer membrane protein [Prevotella sp.]